METFIIYILPIHEQLVIILIPITSYGFIKMVSPTHLSDTGKSYFILSRQDMKKESK